MTNYPNPYGKYQCLACLERFRLAYNLANHNCPNKERKRARKARNSFKPYFIPTAEEK